MENTGLGHAHIMTQLPLHVLRVGARFVFEAEDVLWTPFEAALW